MTRKLAIYCDCDSDSGMLTYTLMLLSALKNHGDIYTLVITSTPRTDQEQTRVDRLTVDASAVLVLKRDYPSAKEAAREMARIIIEKEIDFYFPNYRYMPHLVLSYLPRSIKNIVIVHNDTGEIYQSIRFYKYAIDGVIYPSRAAFSKSDINIPGDLEKAVIPHYFHQLGEPQQRPAGNNRLLVVYHGRVAHTQKKSIELLKIAQQLNLLGVPFTLKIIGTGDALKDIQRQIESDSIENVQLVGQVSRDQLYEQLKDADIALSTSIYEGFCYSVAESLSLGVVPVVYENNVLLDLIQHDKNGYLFPWGRADMVALGIQELYLHPQKKHAMSQAAIDSAQSLMSSTRYADEMLSFLDTVKSRPPGRKWPLLRPRGLPYDTLMSRLVAKCGKKLKLW